MTDSISPFPLYSAAGKLGLIGHVIADYPSPEACRSLVAAMAGAGVSAIEIQIPFSEPVADGPTFAEANQAALRNGVTVEDSFQLINELVQAHPSVQFICMTYANIVYAQGAEEFFTRLGNAGAKAVIIPDWPLDRARQEIALATTHGIAWVPVIAPPTTDERLAQILPLGSGFVYVVARTGVTGTKTEFDSSLDKYLERIRAVRSDLPLAVGFGITDAKDLKAIRNKADYGIVGTHALRLYRDKGLEEVKNFWRQMVASGN